MKVVIDTNVFISSFLSPAGTLRQIINRWRDGKIELCLCLEILEEYCRVLTRMGMATEPEYRELLELFRRNIGISFVVIENDLDVIPEDQDDNKFLECAVAAGAKIIVSGDRHLTALQSWQGIGIVTPAVFLKTLLSKQK